MTVHTRPLAGASVNKEIGAGSPSASHPSPTALTQRPTRLTLDMKLAAGREVAADLHRDCHDFEDLSIEDIAKQLAEHGQQYMDGYELAKEMDRRCYWDCDMQVAECLDHWSSYCRNALEAAQKAWREETNPICPHCLGARVQLTSGETGTITELDYQYAAAACLVAIDRDEKAAPPSNGRRVVFWEDALPMQSEMGAERSEPLPSKGDSR